MGREEYPDNPFVTGPPADALALMVYSNFQLACATGRLDMGVTTHHAQVVGWSLGVFTRSDPETGLFAGLHELACLARSFVHPDKPVPTTSTATCDHEDCDGSCVEQAAFLDAAMHGDFPGAHHVCTAVFKQGSIEDPETGGCSRLARLYGGIVTVLAGSVGAEPEEQTDN